MFLISLRRILPLLFTWVIVASATLAADRKPNVILIMADDLGYETIGANGGTSYKTPVLDQLAATGVRFEHCYAQPLCTPTRVQLMTGLSNARNYIDFGNMDKKAVTFANLLKPAGYATCMVGKWQLGQDAELPKKFGFDESCLWWFMRRAERYKNPGLEINGVSKDWNNNEYGPDLLNDYALDFIQRKKDQPFLLYYAMTLTHDPYEATPDTPGYAGADRKAGKKNAGNLDIRYGNFRDMVQYMDKLIGKLVTKLDALGLRENTLVVFLGDNGTGRDTPSKMGDKVVLGGKGSTTDRGMHVPMIANWPGKISTGKVVADLVDTTDFLPTLLDVAGVSAPANMKFDGRSFLPQLRGERGQPRDWIYSWYSPRLTAKKDVAEFAFNRDFKLYRTGDFYDLRTDREEEHALKVGTLKGESATAAAMLQRALDQYKGARPAHLDEDGDAGAKKKRKQK
jgi:arylsulfatase A